MNETKREKYRKRREDKENQYFDLRAARKLCRIPINTKLD